LKNDELLRDITERNVFGRVIAILTVIDFQKGTLPHSHTLVVLHPDDKLKTPEDTDCLVCAELPDKNIEPDLFETVTVSLLHGPCSIHDSTKPCTVDRKCTRNYPRPFRDTTTLTEDSYPSYRRRDDGRSIDKRS
jgi:hypothetical protein